MRCLAGIDLNRDPGPDATTLLKFTGIRVQPLMRCRRHIAAEAA
jgi:hypothetical protein